MKSASESVSNIVDDAKRLKVIEASESAVNSNKSYVGAERGSSKVKRDAPEHTPIDSPRIETAFSVMERMLHGVALVIRSLRHDAERRQANIPVRTVAANRRVTALEQLDASPVEVALLCGYSSDKSVRQLRAREGRDEATGRPLTADQRPIVSPNRKRVR